MLIFIADVFHTVAKASSIIFNLHWQFFVEEKIFELERLHVQLNFYVKVSLRVRKYFLNNLNSNMKLQNSLKDY